MKLPLILPTLLGMPLFAWGGLLLLLLIIFQVLNGMRVIKVPINCHKGTAVLILILALIHGFAGFAFFQGWIA
ncbi:MAG: hypothetical protein WCQ41_01450 [Bacillota bacterium]